MSKIKITCMKCGKSIKLDFTQSVAICRKCQKKNSHKVYISSKGIV